MKRKQFGLSILFLLKKLKRFGSLTTLQVLPKGLRFRAVSGLGAQCGLGGRPPAPSLTAQLPALVPKGPFFPPL